MYKTIILFILILLVSCVSSKEDKAQLLYNTHCAQCHIAPEIADLPRKIWDSTILPDMASRMGIREQGYDPMKNLSFTEMDAIIKSGIFPGRSSISPEDWTLLRAFILRNAPDSLIAPPNNAVAPELSQFTTEVISLDTNERSTITYLKYDPQSNNLFMGNLAGQILEYDYRNSSTKPIGQFSSAIVDYSVIDKKDYVTTIGSLRPSEIPNGNIFIRSNAGTKGLPQLFHRPVNTLVKDLNKDGRSEIVVSEFGDLTGSLSLFSGNGASGFQKTPLLPRPGSIRVISEDMDGDGLSDLVVLTAQGDEGITIFYQEEPLKFRSDPVIRFSPVYGSSWFELVDYDKDGDKDIITVHGDNADKSFVHKPYHGMRIHINNGNNVFKETFFYPLQGATRVVAEDFDQDGDMDFALLSTFPDYKNDTSTFVYLENSNSTQYQFVAQTFEENKIGRWFLMDSGDVDNDGDTDIVISAFTLAFTPLPPELVGKWKEHDADLIILLNQLKH